MDTLMLLSRLFVAILISMFLTALVWFISHPQRLVQLIGKSRRSHAYDPKELANLDRKGYTDWLSQEFRSIYSSSAFERAHAFSPLYQLIPQQETICEDLAHFYENYLPESGKLKFRQAIGTVLHAQANNLDASPPVILALIRLLGRIKATESLNALVQTIDNEPLLAKVRATESLIALAPTIDKRPIKRQRLGILDETIAVLKMLAPSSDVYQAAFDLANCISFDDGYLFQVMKVMVECEPSRAATIVLTFEPRLSRLQQASLDLGGSAWKAFHEVAEDWAQHMMTVAPISWVKDLWQEASHEWDQIWLFEYIFKNKAKPIALREEFPDRISIECEQEILPLKASRKEYNTLKYIETILAANQFLNEVNHHPISAIYSIVPKIRTRSWTKDTKRAQTTRSESLLGDSQSTIGALMKQKAELIVREELGR